MTTVVVKLEPNKIIISADSLITTESSKEEFSQLNHSLKKIIKIGNDFGYAFSGDIHEHVLFTEYINLANNVLKTPSVLSVINYMQQFMEWKSLYNEDEINNSYVIYCKKRIFLYEGSNGCFEIDNYYAIGSGSKYAMAALYLGHSPEESVNVACVLDLFSGGKIQIMEFRR